MSIFVWCPGRAAWQSQITSLRNDFPYSKHPGTINNFLYALSVKCMGHNETFIFQSPSTLLHRCSTQEILAWENSRYFATPPLVSLQNDAWETNEPITLFPAQQSDRIDCSVPSVTDVIVCEDSVRRKLKAIKPNKSAGPDDIPPNLSKLPEPAIVSPLTGLFSFCAHLGEPLLIGRKLV